MPTRGSPTHALPVPIIHRDFITSHMSSTSLFLDFVRLPSAILNRQPSLNMSITKTKPIPYKEALSAANQIVAQLEPFCDRIAIAGSIRRKKLFVNDIEIVCIPKVVKDKVNLFEMGYIRHPEFVAVVNQWEKIKGEAIGKYTQRLIYRDLVSGERPFENTQGPQREEKNSVVPIKLDLFTARPENWGYILAIRTGSAEFSKRLAHHWKIAGYMGHNGNLCHRMSLTAVPVREEIDLFQLIGIPWIKPENRK